MRQGTIFYFLGCSVDTLKPSGDTRTWEFLKSLLLFACKKKNVMKGAIQLKKINVSGKLPLL